MGFAAGPRLMESDQAQSIGLVIGGLVFLVVLLVERVVKKASPYALLGGCVGVVTAIVVSLILRSALGLEGIPMAIMLSILVVCSHIGFVVGARAVRVMRLAAGGKSGLTSSISPKVLDTSAIIDGRIVEMVELGFLSGPMVVAQFVLNELQAIADSSDALRRARGRRGLGILERLQAVDGLEIRIVDEDFPRAKEVDAKIIEMAKQKSAMVVTTDFNLSKVAELQGVRVLNVHQLSQAVRPVVLPGEHVRVTIQKNGKEFGQGVGYMEDGTMVVVDGGATYMDESVETIVTSVLQTTAGRMIFSRMPESADVVDVKEKRRVWRRRG
jgi:uncharacterized protein YacL